MSALRSRNPWLALCALCLGLFMILLDTTIVNVAVPSMLTGLNTGLDEILWVVNVYILAYAVPLIVASRLGDRFGRKKLYIIGLMVFTAASALCGMADSGEQLIIARAFQGIGAALMNPQTLAFIAVLFPPKKRGAAFGVWSAVAGVATIAGPLLGGLIVEKLDWQWIFFVNVPVGVLGLLLALLWVPESRTDTGHNFAPLGIVLLTGSLFLVTFGLLEGSRYGWGTITGWLSIPVLLGGGLALLLAFVLVQLRSADPLVPVTLFTNRNFTLANVVATAVGFAMVSLLPLMIFLQTVLHLTPLEAGVVTAPASVIAAAIAPFAGFRADRTGGKFLLIAGLLAFAAGIAAAAVTAKPGNNSWMILPAVAAIGVGIGLLFTTMTTVAIGEVSPDLSGAASGVFNTTRQLGQALGTAAVGALLQATLRHALEDEATRRSTELPAASRQRFIDSFADAGDSGLFTHAPKGTSEPGAVGEHVRQLGIEVFNNGFVSAMRWTLLLSMGFALVAVACCFGIKVRRHPVQPTEKPLQPSRVSS
ncbi:MFS transporter [Streptomyces sp. NPDC051162]|uniref:MFS transporter n=1 Tax=unclassified Streptomyces TaxID=2593676 RepID=UPI0034353085